MKLGKIILALACASSWGQVAASESKDEQIDYILTQVQSAPQQQKEQILERLQWSGLSDPRLFDVFEDNLLQHYQDKYPADDLADLLAYQARALGYSGNEKYQKTLSLLADEAKNSSLRRHAKNGKRDLETFIQVQSALQQVQLSKGERSFEVFTYSKMLETADPYTQRLAARAIYHEKRDNQALLDLTAEKLQDMYMNEDLDSLAQDTAAWMCKVLKQHSGYEELLDNVAENTPHRKIRRYAE
jgi:hypothetical protein